MLLNIDVFNLVPLVNVLVGGDLYALRWIYEHLKKQIPVIIVNQSRSLANLICKYLKLTETTTQHRDDSTKHEHESKNTNHLPMLNHYFSEKILKEVFYPLGKIIVNIYKDLQQLYSIIRQEEYEYCGKKLPVDKLFDLNDENILKDYLFCQQVHCNTQFTIL
ncbi:unnamed protein product [Rotaria sordida]|uniref:Uncharacterized protein n=1 Tax=Rotaria sordida TaxID=392033 RepID=A0A815GIE7_9BILA|nr:unnamed protein product [Rotaria sordida]